MPPKGQISASLRLDTKVYKLSLEEALGDAQKFSDSLKNGLKIPELPKLPSFS